MNEYMVSDDLVKEKRNKLYELEKELTKQILKKQIEIQADNTILFPTNQFVSAYRKK